ncbi:hypothetical protein HLB27_04265 [Dickeya dadantii]|uniref:hypothetical protein n=1 Tax=Dickeya dadantii TaxID=204038 RepID=UPI0014957D11|nr:hypothetical protein [Dickeya dadantii]NPE58047.1 hypothetical protein [Dickeya dadantii]NPE69958.1 hypothetical protein [Dickeya dadantii]
MIFRPDFTHNEKLRLFTIYLHDKNEQNKPFNLCFDELNKIKIQMKQTEKKRNIHAREETLFINKRTLSIHNAHEYNYVLIIPDKYQKEEIMMTEILKRHCCLGKAYDNPYQSFSFTPQRDNAKSVISVAG